MPARRGSGMSATRRTPGAETAACRGRSKGRLSGGPYSAAGPVSGIPLVPSRCGGVWSLRPADACVVLMMLRHAGRSEPRPQYREVLLGLQLIQEVVGTHAIGCEP